MVCIRNVQNIYNTFVKNNFNFILYYNKFVIIFVATNITYNGKGIYKNE